MGFPYTWHAGETHILPGWFPSSPLRTCVQRVTVVRVPAQLTSDFTHSAPKTLEWWHVPAGPRGGHGFPRPSWPCVNTLPLEAGLRTPLSLAWERDKFLFGCCLGLTIYIFLIDLTPLGLAVFFFNGTETKPQVPWGWTKRMSEDWQLLILPTQHLLIGLQSSLRKCPFSGAGLQGTPREPFAWTNS